MANNLNVLYGFDEDPERKPFIERLLEFSKTTDNPISACPTIKGRSLDLFRLCSLVRKRGGFKAVGRMKKENGWQRIATELGFAPSSFMTRELKDQFSKNLLKFSLEEVYEKYELGGEPYAPQRHSKSEGGQSLLRTAGQMTAAPVPTVPAAGPMSIGISQVQQVPVRPPLEAVLDMPTPAGNLLETATTSAALGRAPAGGTTEQGKLSKKQSSELAKILFAQNQKSQQLTLELTRTRDQLVLTRAQHRVELAQGNLEVALTEATPEVALSQARREEALTQARRKVALAEDKLKSRTALLSAALQENRRLNVEVKMQASKASDIKRQYRRLKKETDRVRGHACNWGQLAKKAGLMTSIQESILSDTEYIHATKKELD